MNVFQRWEIAENLKVFYQIGSAEFLLPQRVKIKLEPEALMPKPCEQECGVRSQTDTEKLAIAETIRTEKVNAMKSLANFKTKTL